MQRPALLLALLPVLALPSVGCSKARKPAVEVPSAPSAIADLDQFEEAYNGFALLPDAHPRRDSYRKVLLGFLLRYLDDAVKSGDEQQALSALRYAVSLWTPAELRVAPASPALARNAHRVYRMAARHGAEEPSFLALAIEQRFGDAATRKQALGEWETLEAWLLKNGPYASEPLLRHEDLEHALEQVTAAFPSPFVTKRLEDLYVARYDAARQARMQGRAVGSASLRRMEITGYLLLRLYLRADDLPSGLAAMDRVELDAPVRKLKAITEDALKPRRSALPLLGLAEQFVPEPELDPSDPFVVQGWAIVDALSRRAVDQYPKDAYSHLLRARSLSHDGLTEAAIVHLRRAIDLKEDVFEAWQALAELEQQHLTHLAEVDAERASARLADVESLHKRAAELWSDRPIRPGLPEAFYTVAEGLYHAGEVDRAEALLERSLGIEPVPNSLDLLGTIALKRSKLRQAADRYENLSRLSYGSELAQLRWEARARQQLGQIAAQRGDASGSTRHFRIALRHTNDLISRPAAEPTDRANHYVERGKLLFNLGEVDLAMSDFRRAADVSPESVKAYADPLRFVVALGHYDKARDIFRRAMAQGKLSGSLKLYFSLWVRELAKRQGFSPDAEALDYLRDYDGDRWGAALAKHARGQLAFDKLLAQAENRGERAEAFFYEGLQRWSAGDKTEGKRLMGKVLETQMMGFFEYDMALDYLRWDELPKAGRRPTAKAAQR